MGAAVGTEEGKGGRAVNVDVNVVPFIDLMSCLTAFLLVTAVWTNLAQINIKPKGIGRDAERTLPEQIPVNGSILLTKSEIWVGTTQGEMDRIPNPGENRYDFDRVQEILKEYKNPAHPLSKREDIEIAAEDDVAYEHIIATMDLSIASGFRDIGFVDPQSLSVRFKQ
jgi:biopolymer transport protein ExbD